MSALQEARERAEAIRLHLQVGLGHLAKREPELALDAIHAAVGRLERLDDVWAPDEASMDAALGVLVTAQEVARLAGELDQADRAGMLMRRVLTRRLRTLR